MYVRTTGTVKTAATESPRHPCQGWPPAPQASDNPHHQVSPKGREAITETQHQALGEHVPRLGKPSPRSRNIFTMLM